MNILTDILPDFISIGRWKCAIRTDFRIWMEFDSLLNCTDIEDKDKIMMILKLCIDNEGCIIFQDDMKEAMKELCSFYLCGKEQIKKKDTGRRETNRAVDFSLDSGYIYSAFLTQYGIDLISIPYMHWYVFCSLLDGLEEARKIKKIIGFRLCRPEDSESDDRRRYLRRMKEIYALPDARSEKEKEEEIAEILSSIF